MDATTSFAFVAMPFADEYDWLFTAIKKAGDECGVYVDRVDKQLVTTTIAEHAHNPINIAIPPAGRSRPPLGLR
jgi:hypothetical protein